MKWVLTVMLVACIVAVSMAEDGKKCKSADDCGEDECCVNYVITTIFGGKCRKLRKEGENCTPLSHNEILKPKMYHYQCPCKEGLECKAQYEIKIGEVIIRHKPECVDPTAVTEVTIPDVSIAA